MLGTLAALEVIRTLNDAGIETELPVADIAAETGTKVIAAPMAGGPFVAASGEVNLTDAEPRAKDESWNERRGKPEA